MAILISFIMLILGLLVADLPAALWLGRTHRAAHIAAALTVAVCATMDWVVETHREAVSTPAAVQDFVENILFLTNHPEYRVDGCYNNITEKEDLCKLVTTTAKPVLWKPVIDEPVVIKHDVAVIAYDMYVDDRPDGEVTKVRTYFGLRYHQWKGWRWERWDTANPHELGYAPSSDGVDLGAWYNP